MIRAAGGDGASALAPGVVNTTPSLASRWRRGRRAAAPEAAGFVSNLLEFTQPPTRLRSVVSGTGPEASAVMPTSSSPFTYTIPVGTDFTS